MKYLNKSFSIESVKAEYLAKKFGTPIYCYSYKKLKTNIINFKNNFKSFNPLICFSVKSNTNVNLLRQIRKLGCGADVVSIGELMKALKAGVNTKKIVFSGVGKTTEELNYAINKNILLINAESKSEVIEIEKIAKSKKKIVNIGIRLNQNPPNIVIEKSSTGGIAIAQQVKLKKMSEKLVKDILNIYGYTSARVVIREDIDSEQLIDFITGSKTYAKSITVLNKIDLVDEKFLKKVSKKIKTEFIPVSADANDNITELRDRIYDELQFIRIYMRPKGGKTDYKEPLIIRNGNSVLDVCNKLHRKLKRDFRYGLVWGKSVKFAGQRVGRNHVLRDEDVLTIIKIKGT